MSKLSKEEIEKKTKQLLRKLDEYDRRRKDNAEARAAMKEGETALLQKIYELRQEVKTGERWVPEQGVIPGVEGASEDED